MSNQYDDFFNEDGDIINTQWGIEEQKEHEEERKRQEQLEHERSLHEADRIAGIDKKKSDAMERMERNRKARELKNSWASMPNWIKEMPRTPLSAAPTEGTSNKLKYNVFGKVQLTENEKNKRLADLKRLHQSIEDYNSIHQDAIDNRMPSVAVIPTADGSGGTVITRLLSKAIAESRHDLGNVVSIDLGTRNHQLVSWFQDNRGTRYINMNSLLNIIGRQSIDEYSPPELLPKAGRGEYYLVNSGSGGKKIDPSAEDVVTLYDFVNNGKSSGVTLLDCDPFDHDSMAMSSAISVSTVFIVNLMEGEERLSSAITTLRRVINDEEVFDDIIRNAIIVGNITDEEGMNKENFTEAINSLKECSRISGIPLKRCHVIPYENSLSNPPLKWNDISWTTKHSLRKVCGDIINIIKEN